MNVMKMSLYECDEDMMVRKESSVDNLTSYLGRESDLKQPSATAAPVSSVSNLGRESDLKQDMKLVKVEEMKRMSFEKKVKKQKRKIALSLRL
ncbi:PREDICTED: uncharacterized protein LOC104707651 isoform X2 [Camelina sativa]|uniref:Uncharacterized protein LOC104707651 isoform X2 n=1 Tax=Camelina sativa TaxID=90675 RepID=A0ABM0T877_CAMSA|nr:PREDICTED: uncharacterized protein LOC104707651 isoform X2 [Camelina sativa]